MVGMVVTRWSVSSLKSVHNELVESNNFHGIVGRRVVNAGKAVDNAIKAPHSTFSAVAHKLHLLLLARFEAKSGGGRYVEVTPKGFATWKLHVAIHLKEVEVPTCTGRSPVLRTFTVTV
jgi:deoxycytidine triphosphate deaminase